DQHPRRCRRGVRGARGAFPGRDRCLPRHADRASPARQRADPFQARPVRACGALPDVAPRRARCPRPPADRGPGGGPHGFRDVAPQGRVEPLSGPILQPSVRPAGSWSKIASPAFLPPDGEGKRVFVKVYDVTARIAAEAQDRLRAEAYELLAPIYGWFTEGFD